MNAIHDSERDNGPIDRLLQRFFEAEMPRPWPAWNGPPTEVLTAPPPRSEAIGRSRLSLALAASLLVGLAALLNAWPNERPAAPGTARQGGLIESGTAKVPKELLPKGPK